MNANTSTNTNTNTVTNPVAASPAGPLDKSRCNGSKDKGANTRPGHTEAWLEQSDFPVKVGGKIRFSSQGWGKTKQRPGWAQNNQIFESRLGEN